MPNADIFFQNSDAIIFMLALSVLVAKLFGTISFNIKKEFRSAWNWKIILCEQPWLPALIILLSVLVSYSILHFRLFNDNDEAYAWVIRGEDIISAIFSVWLLLGEVRVIYNWLTSISYQKSLLQALLPYIKNSLYFMGLFLALPFLIPSFLQTPMISYITAKITSVLIIWTVAWLIIEVIVGFENLTLQRLNGALSDNFRARRVYTQARLFKRMAMVFVFIIASALSAMMFDSIREIGTSILASAGLATVILGFAAQKTLGNLFAGVQIAVTQPIRIHDTVTIDNEFGIVEEISLTYVVIRIWDLRRLIVPINYFLEKSFQNLTRSSTNLLCPVVFFADYTLPVDAVRAKFMEILAASKFWDGQVASLQVTDIKDSALQMRALASAKDSGDAWNLRCEISEKLIGFMVKEYPHSLPKTRNHYEQSPLVKHC